VKLVPGTKLGPYEIVGAIGAGGMGEVYKARDARLDRYVAVKVLPASTAPDPDSVALLQREARTIAALSHANILAVFDVGVDANTAYVVTELLEGETLRERLARGALQPAAAAQLALQLARGLAAAHDRGIVHRDLKPENVFLTANGGLKILDFGIASQATAAAAEMTMAGGTVPGVIMGTVGYMSPEQARGAATDSRSDIFALGTILYEMLAGRRAFDGSSPTDILASVVRDEPPPLPRGGTIPVALERIVGRCLEKPPSGRFQSAHDLAFALEALGGTGPVGVLPVVPASTLKAIVVLPFENMSPDADNEFFADGLTEELISDLSKIVHLRVISRTSAMRLKGRRDVENIARELSIGYLLSGSVRRAGAKLRITAQLVEAASDRQIWSEKYHGTLDDVFDIQEQVSRAIARELEVKLTPEESRDIAQRPVEDARAYECYLRARSEVCKFTEEGLDRAMRDIDHAMAIVGENVRLLAVKGEICWQYYNLGISTDPRRLAEVRSIAKRIEQLDAESPHLHRLMVFDAVHSAGDMRAAQRHAERALAADPNDTLTATLHALTCAYLGESARAAGTAQRLLEIDPLQPLTHLMIGCLRYFDGSFSAALKRFDRAVELDPDMSIAIFYQAQTLAALGRTPDALAASERMERDPAGGMWSWIGRAWKAGLQGDGSVIRETITEERRAWCATDPTYSQMLAEAFAMAGARDEAFEWLGIAIGRGLLCYDFIARLDPFLAPLREDPRWPTVLERVKAIHASGLTPSKG
jgi:serine/threonine protein kinase/tetratricopeptide (TPR) repeat protein